MAESTAATITAAMEAVMCFGYREEMVLKAAEQLALYEGISLDSVKAIDLLILCDAAQANQVELFREDLTPTVAASTMMRATTSAGATTSSASATSYTRMSETSGVTMTHRMKAVALVFDFREELVLEAARQLALSRGIPLDDIDAAVLVQYCEEAAANERRQRNVVPLNCMATAGCIPTTSTGTTSTGTRPAPTITSTSAC